MSLLSNDFLCGFILGGISIALILCFAFRKTVNDDMDTIFELQNHIKELERKNAKLIHFIKFKLHRDSD